MPLYLKGNRPAPGEVDRRYYLIDVQEGGRRVRVSSGTRDREAALRKEQQVLDALRRDPETPREDLVDLVRGAGTAVRRESRRRGAWTFEGACRECLNNRRRWLGRKGWATLTTDTYRSNVNSLLRYIDPARPVARVDQEVLDDTVEAMLRGGPKRRALSETTVNRLMYALRSILEFAKWSDQYPGEVPEHYPFDEDNAREFVFTHEQEEELYAAVLKWNSLPDEPSANRPRHRDAAEYIDLFQFLADVGCRLSAALNVKWKDITPIPSGEGVRFWGRKNQKGSKDRTTPLTARARKIIERRRASHGHQPGPFTNLYRSRASKLWNYGKEQTSFAKEEDAVIHALRHTCATRLLYLTGDMKLVQDWLGHTNITTTSDIYAKVVVEAKTKAARLLDAQAQVTREVTPEAPFQDREVPETGMMERVTH